MSLSFKNGTRIIKPSSSGAMNNIDQEKNALVFRDCSKTNIFHKHEWRRTVPNSKEASIIKFNQRVFYNRHPRIPAIVYDIPRLIVSKNGNVRLNRDLLFGVAVNVIRNHFDKRDVGPLKLPLVSRTCYTAVRSCFVTLNRVYRSIDWEDYAEIKNFVFKDVIRIPGELLDFVIRAGLVSIIGELQLGQGHMDSFFNNIASSVLRLDKVSGNFSWTESFVNVLRKFAPEIQTYGDKYGTAPLILERVPTNVCYPAIEVKSIADFTALNLERISSLVFRLEFQKVAICPRLINFVRSSGAKEIYIQDIWPPRRREKRSDSREWFEEMLEESETWKLNQNEFRPSLEHFSLQFSRSLTDHISMKSLKDVFFIFYHSLPKTKRFDLNVDCDNFKPVDIWDFSTVLRDFYSLDSTTQAINLFAIFRRQIPIDDAPGSVAETLDVLRCIRKHLIVHKARESRWNKQEQCYAENSYFDLNRPPSFSYLEVSGEMSILHYAFHLSSNDQREWKAVVEINFRFIVKPKPPAVTLSLYAIPRDLRKFLGRYPELQEDEDDGIYP